MFEKMRKSVEVKYDFFENENNKRRIESRCVEKIQSCKPLNPCIKSYNLCFKKKSVQQITYTNLLIGHYDNAFTNSEKVICNQVSSSRRGDINFKNDFAKFSGSSKFNKTEITCSRVVKSENKELQVKDSSKSNCSTHQVSASQVHSKIKNLKKKDDIQKEMNDLMNKLLTENSDFRDAYSNIVAFLNDFSHLPEDDYIKTILQLSKLEPTNLNFNTSLNYKTEFLEKPSISCDNVVPLCMHSKKLLKLENGCELEAFDCREPLLQELRTNKKYSKILKNISSKLSSTKNSPTTPPVLKDKHLNFIKPDYCKSVKSLNNAYNHPSEIPKTRQSLTSLLSILKPNFSFFSHSNEESYDDSSSTTSYQEDPNYYDYETFPKPIPLNKYKKYDRHHLSFDLHPSKKVPPLANLHDEYIEEHPLRPVTSEPNYINHNDFKYFDDSDEEDIEGYTDINNNLNNDKETFPPLVLNTANSKIVVDIYKAESDYVSNLDNIVEGFLHKCHGVLKDEDIKKIFGNIEEVRSFSKDFLLQLQTCVWDKGPDKACIGAVFIRNYKKFEVYKGYCLGNQASSECLNDLNKVPPYRIFLEQCRIDRGMIELPLQAFLLTPVQKICKYPLQLKQLHRCVPPNHNDYANLKLATELMLSMATKINEIKKLQELECELRKCGNIIGWKGPEINHLESPLTHTGQLIKVSNFHKLFHTYQPK